MSKLNSNLNPTIPPETEDQLKAELQQLKRDLAELEEQIKPLTRAISLAFQAKQIIEWKLYNLHLLKIRKNQPKYPDTPTRTIKPLPQVNLADYD